MGHLVDGIEQQMRLDAQGTCELPQGGWARLLLTGFEALDCGLGQAGAFAKLPLGQRGVLAQRS
jgi:hypothetical protein